MCQVHSASATDEQRCLPRGDRPLFSSSRFAADGLGTAVGRRVKTLETRSGVCARDRHMCLGSGNANCKVHLAIGSTGARGGVRGVTLQSGVGRNVKRFRGWLVFKAHRLVYYSTLGLRVIKKKTNLRSSTAARASAAVSAAFTAAALCGERVLY